MAQRRRRSLLSGADKSEGAEGADSGASEGQHSDPAETGALAESTGDAASSGEAVASTSEAHASTSEADASAGEAHVPEPAHEPVAEDPWAAPAPVHTPDPWAAPAEDVPAADPWAPAPPAPPPDAGGYEVSEERRSVGGYQSTAKNLADTTDSGWSSSAFRSGGGQPSLPPGWDSPSATGDTGPVRPMSPFANKADFFSEEPPTEEQPSAVYENRSTSQAAPMNVPASGAIPGLGGRKTFGAAPAGDSYVTSGPPEVGAPSGKSFGSAPAAGASNRPSYLPPETPKKPPARGASPSPAPAPSRPMAPVDDDDEEKSGPPMMVLAGGFIVIVMGVVVLGLVVMIGTGVFSAAPVVPPPPAVVVLPPPPLVVAPPVVGDTDVPPIAADPPVVGTTTPPVAVEATKVPPPETKAVAKVPPPDKPKDVKKVVKSPAGAKGTLKIRSNRRVLVKVNGQPKDYTPLDLPADAGAYTISAALPGKPDSEQSFSIDLKSGVTEAVNFSF